MAAKALNTNIWVYDAKIVMGKGSGSTNTVTSSAAPPQYVADAYQNAIGAAQSAASKPLQQYQGPMVAGFTPNQNQAFNQIQNAQNIALPYEQQAAQSIANSQTNIWGNAPQYSANSVNQYYNPYQQDVVNSTMANINETNAEQQQGVVGNAITSGAWGGDRSAVAQSELARQQGLANNQTLAQLQQQGFTGAQSEFNSQQGANISAQEAQNWLASNAGYGYGQLGTSSLQNQLAGSSALLQAGGLQQQLGQEVLNVPYEQFQAQQAYPLQTAQYFANIAEGIGGSSPLTTSTTSPGPSTASQIGGLGLAGLGGLSSYMNPGTSATSSLSGQNRGGSIHYAGGGRIPRFQFGGMMDLPTVPDAGASYIPANATNTNMPSTMQRWANQKSTSSAPQQDVPVSQQLLQDMALTKSGRDVASGGQNLYNMVNKWLPSSGGDVGSAGVTSGLGSSGPMSLPSAATANDMTASALEGTAGVPAMSLPVDTAAGMNAGVGAAAADSALASTAGTAAEAAGAQAATAATTAALTDTAATTAADSGILSGLGALLALQRGGRIPRRDAGGQIGGLQPTAQNANPLVSNQYAQFAGMSPEQLQELAVRMPPNTAKGQLLQKALQQQHFMPAPQQDNQPQAGFARGGSLRRYADGSTVDYDSGNGGLNALGDYDVPTAGLSQAVQDTSANDALKQIAANPGNYGIPPVSDTSLNTPSQSNVIPMKPPQSGLGAAQSVPDQAVNAAPIDNARLAVPSQPQDMGTPPTIHQPVQAAAPDLGQSLMQAGFAMMAGRSPHALENIGAGAMSGLQNWNEQKKQNQNFATQQNDVQSKADQLVENAYSHRTDEKQNATKIQNEADYQHGMLQNDTTKTAQQGRYQNAEIANMQAERQKPIPDGMGGFIIPNPNDPAHPIQIASPLSSTEKPSLDANGQPLTGEAYLATLPTTRAAELKALDEGRMNYPSSFAQSKPYYQQMLAQLYQYNPQASQQTAAAVKAFNQGKQGDQTRFLNVAVNHLDTLSGLADALHNNDVKALNTIGNFWQSQTGSPAPTNFETAKQIVGDEVTKAVIGSGGGVADRDKAQAVINAANSPEQLKGAIETYKQLMTGQLGGLKQQYENSTGRKDFERYLTPAAQKALMPQQQTQGGALSIPPPDQRKIGQVYTNPNGKTATWTANGWVAQ